VTADFTLEAEFTLFLRG